LNFLVKLAKKFKCVFDFPKIIIRLARENGKDEEACMAYPSSFGLRIVLLLPVPLVVLLVPPAVLLVRRRQLA
jgi:hypothetical protein